MLSHLAHRHMCFPYEDLAKQLHLALVSDVLLIVVLSLLSVCVCFGFGVCVGGGGVDGVSRSQGDGSPQGCLANFFPEQGERGEEREEREIERQKREIG